MKTNMNAPLTQGATWTGRAPRSEQQVSLWVLAFMVREAVLVAPDNMEKKRKHKSVWVRIRDGLSGLTEGVPYILSSFAHLRVPPNRDVSGCWKKEDFLQAFYLTQPYFNFYDNRPTFCDDLEWPNPMDVQPFWCKLIMDLNAARATRNDPPLVLCLESYIFTTHPRFPLFKVQYEPLTAAPSSKAKRARASTDSEHNAGLVSRTNTKSGPSGSFSKSAATAAQSPGPSHRTKPKAKRPRYEPEPEDVEMADEADESSPPPALPQPTPDKKGKGREVVPPPDRKGKGREVEPPLDKKGKGREKISLPEASVELQDAICNQDVVFEAALKEQLSPIPCKACAQGGHDCFVVLRHFHGCWRCKVGSNGCSLAPKAEYSAKGELKNMKGPSHWPWYITLVFHVLNVLALDTEEGPQHLSADYTGVTIPPFPSKKPLSMLKTSH
ncbi:hypothetical protein QCA50_005508 [Cerrena zonata]|uniref:Uncharacterized protein n=1 Tax=Cerrena zonata TaxID=2478898 RepID=A0AAW0GAK6_9APHY